MADLLELYQNAIARSRAKPVTLGAKTSTVVSVRFTKSEAEAIRKIAKSSGINGTPSELIRAVTLAYGEKDPDAARCLLAVYLAKADPLDGAGRSKRRPLSAEELAYCEREKIDEREFFSRAAARVKASKTKKVSKGREQLAQRPRPRALTKLERDYCTSEGISEDDFLARAKAKRNGFRGR